MKLLADTSVWSLALRRRTGATFTNVEKTLATVLGEAISDGRVVIIGPIRQELLSGIKEQAQFEKVKNALQTFPDELLQTLDYEEAARCYNLCRSRGIDPGPIDILICAVAVRRHWRVLANDLAMNRCCEIIAGSPSQ